jgi:hypothetical protein
VIERRKTKDERQETSDERREREKRSEAKRRERKTANTTGTSEKMKKNMGNRGGKKHQNRRRECGGSQKVPTSKRTEKGLPSDTFQLFRRAVSTPRREPKMYEKRAPRVAFELARFLTPEAPIRFWTAKKKRSEKNRFTFFLAQCGGSDRKKEEKRNEMQRKKTLHD